MDLKTHSSPQDHLSPKTLSIPNPSREVSTRSASISTCRSSAEIHSIRPVNMTSSSPFIHSEEAEEKSASRSVSTEIAEFKHNMRVVEGELLHTKSVLDEMKRREMHHQKRVAQVMQDTQRREEILVEEIQSLRDHKSQVERSLEEQLQRSYADAAELRQQVTKLSENYNAAMANSGTFIESLDDAIRFYRSEGSAEKGSQAEEVLQKLDRLVSESGGIHKEVLEVSSRVEERGRQRDCQLDSLKRVVESFDEFFKKDTEPLQVENEKLRQQVQDLQLKLCSNHCAEESQTKVDILQQQVRALREKATIAEVAVTSLEEEVKRQALFCQQRLGRQAELHKAEVAEMRCQIKLLQQEREEMAKDVSRAAQKLVLKENEALAARKEIREQKQQVLQLKKALEDILSRFSADAVSTFSVDAAQLEYAKALNLESEVDALRASLQLKSAQVEEYSKEKKHLAALKKMFTLHERERKCHLEASKDALQVLESSATLQLSQMRALASARTSAAEEQIKSSQETILEFHRLTESARRLVTEHALQKSIGKAKIKGKDRPSGHSTVRKKRVAKNGVS